MRPIPEVSLPHASPCLDDVLCSLRYHKLHPNYVYERLKELGKLYSLRLLLVLVDSGDYTKSLRELTRVSIALDFCMVLAWSNEEAGRYLETFKAFEHKTADAIKTKVGNSTLDRLTFVLSNIRSVNKTDSLTLATQFPVIHLLIAVKFRR
jgi:DNA repair protein Rad10